MSFLNPIALFLAALGGLIVLMYLLKLKRKPEDFSSTLLWIKTMEDLTANAPFQKLRQNLLMYLQILLILLLAFSLSRPTMWLNRRGGISQIVLIDNSASMNATDVAPSASRLEAAKELAGELVNNMGPGDQMMVITFGGLARVVSPFTSEKGTLAAAIRGIAPTDAQARIREALLLAQGVRRVDVEAKITIVSDGGVGYLGDLIKEDDPMEFLRIGNSGDNLGIVSFDLRESFERRGELQVFAEIENFSTREATVLVRCLVDDEVVQVREALLAPAGKRGFVFTGLRAGSSSRLKIELGGSDDLATDDVAYGVLDLAPPLRILLVTQGNFFLQSLLALLPGGVVSLIEPENFDPTADYDIVLFDQFSPPELGPGRYLFMNALPPFPGFSLGEEPRQNQMIVDWNRLHPVTRFLNLDALVVAETMNLTAPDWIEPLAESVEMPLITAGESQGVKLVGVAFDIYGSDWPLQVSFPIFFANAIRWLGAEGDEGGTRRQQSTGDIITLTAETEIEVIGPGGESWTVQPDENGLAYFSQTLWTGLYETRVEGERTGGFALNLLSPLESDILPKGELISAEKQIVATLLAKENREVWPWFAVIGLAVMALEWHIYCRRSWL